jgi:hypothetical protein
MSIPPSKQHLEALAGWSLVQRANASDRQHLALCSFGESCGELAEVVEELVSPLPPGTTAQVAPSRQLPPAGADVPEIPREVQELVFPQLLAASECQHKFDIRTQKCVYCGKTYFQVKARKPELM